TASGPVLLEFNSRFGDPESINVLSLYETLNFDEVLHGVATGRVNPTQLQFRLRASVVRYVVPPGYPEAPRAGGLLEIDESAIEDLGVQVRYGAVEPAGAGRVTMTTSRAIALVGEASAIHAASTRVEAALAYVRGDYRVRHDIGTQVDVTRRLEHVRRIIVPGAKPSPLPLSVAAPEAAPSSLGRADQVLT
ncbi:MAG: hypothetical protein L3J73_00005, partial [Thermoplasmata archaeon]|nr:hypothetical protein [Thermoplasmata archaeon]